MWQQFFWELKRLRSSPWELFLLLIAPWLVIVFMASMFSSGSAHKLPIAIVDQDHSPFSRQVIRYVQASPSLNITLLSSSMLDAEDALKRCKVWAVLQIPTQAEVRLHRHESPRLVSYYNAAFFSIASTVSSGINAAVGAAINEEQKEILTTAGAPPIRLEMPAIQIVPLYNPQLSYELFLEPFAVPAVLHLILACCVAGSMTAGFSPQLQLHQHIFSALLGKVLPYIFMFSLWCFLWTFWMTVIRGWAVQGSVILLLLAQFLLFAAYAFFVSSVVLLLKDINTAMSLIAIYAGSSLSFAGVSLPTNTASLFTRIWSESLPYTSFSKLQTEQWIIGTPILFSLTHLIVLSCFVVGLGGLSYRLLKKNWQTVGVST